MDKTVLEQKAKELFGGATIDIKPYQDAVRTAWDVTIVPFIDKETRFIRVDTSHGEAITINYLKKIQQYLLKLKHNSVIGLNPIEESIDPEKLGEEIAKRLPKDATKPIYACSDCNKQFKYPGPFVMHQKRHKKQVQSISRAVNDPLIYETEK